MVQRDERISYRISDDPKQLDQERERLAHLAARADGETRDLLARLGVGAGWHCLEAGAGSGSVAHWLGERVGPSGRVLSVDVDTRLHAPVPDPVEVRQLDLTAEPLEQGAFDLVHARALLQHLHQREVVLDALVAALRPGGWIALEDGDWTGFYDQPLPEEFAALSRAGHEQVKRRSGWDPACGRWLLGALRARGLAQCESRGRIYTMFGGTPSAEWYVAGLARAREEVAGAGPERRAFVEKALEQARDPGFAALSPVSFQAWGRRPA